MSSQPSSDESDLLPPAPEGRSFALSPGSRAFGWDFGLLAWERRDSEFSSILANGTRNTLSLFRGPLRFFILGAATPNLLVGGTLGVGLRFEGKDDRTTWMEAEGFPTFEWLLPEMGTTRPFLRLGAGANVSWWVDRPDGAEAAVVLGPLGTAAFGVHIPIGRRLVFDVALAFDYRAEFESGLVTSEDNDGAMSFLAQGAMLGLRLGVTRYVSAP